MTLAFDGLASAAVGSASSYNLSALTTANAHDVIVLMVSGPTTTQAPTISDTAGLTWAQRFTWVNTTPYWIGGYWAVASAPLTNDVITVNFGSVQNIRAIAFGVSGANITSPWDTNAALPASWVPGSSPTYGTDISITAADTLAFVCGSSSGANRGAPSGWTWPTLPVGNSNEFLLYQIFSAPQSGLKVVSPWGGLQVSWGDAIVAPSNIVPSSAIGRGSAHGSAGNSSIVWVKAR